MKLIRDLLRVKKSPFLIKNNWALITGATGDIGGCYCELLAKDNINLILIGRNSTKVNHLKNKLSKYNISIEDILIDFDSMNHNEIEALVNSKIKDKQLSILINCIGEGGKAEDFSNLSLQNIQTMININVLSHLLITNLFIQNIQNNLKNQNDKRVIINISSFLGLKPSPGLALYSSSKSLINNFFNIISHENSIKSNNISIITFNPWYIDTKMVNRISIIGKVSVDSFCSTSFNQSFYPYRSSSLLRYQNSIMKIGVLRHTIIYYLMCLIPNRLFSSIFYKFIMKYKTPSLSELRKRKNK